MKIIKLLISPINIEEVEDTLRGEPDIVDIKNPLEGSLGANFPWVISLASKRVSEHNSKLKLLGINKTVEVSAAIGDFPNLPGSASLAALGAAVCGVNYVKIGMMGPKSKESAIKLATEVVKAIKDYNSKIKVVITGYADQHLLDKSISPLSIPEITGESGADVAMLDTAVKNGKSLFENLSLKKIQKFKKQAKKYELEIALAGSLRFNDLDMIKTLNPDILGVRSMVCDNFDRINGKINPSLINKIKNKIYF